MRGFLQWEPFIPTGRKGKIDLKGFADLLAPLTRMLRDDVTDEQFADAYALKLLN